MSESKADYDYSQYTSRADVQAVIHALGGVRTFEELTAWLAQSMRISPFLDWPMYNGSLGEDSGGGTRLADYIALNELGILTLGSQDGFCDPEGAPSDPPTQPFLDYVNELTGRQLVVADTVDYHEEQISQLDCMMTLQQFNDLVPRLTKPGSGLETYIIHHPLLADKYVWKVESGTGRLMPLAKWPTMTTTTILLKSGEQLEFPNPLRTEVTAAVPTDIGDLVKQSTNQKLRSYFTGTLRNFVEWESSVVPRLQIHPSLLFDLQLKPLVICNFLSSDKCTLPLSAAVTLLELVRQPAPPSAAQYQRRRVSRAISHENHVVSTAGVPVRRM